MPHQWARNEVARFCRCHRSYIRTKRMHPSLREYFERYWAGRWGGLVQAMSVEMTWWRGNSVPMTLLRVLSLWAYIKYRTGLDQAAVRNRSCRTQLLMARTVLDGEQSMKIPVEDYSQELNEGPRKWHWLLWKDSRAYRRASTMTISVFKLEVTWQLKGKPTLPLRF